MRAFENGSVINIADYSYVKRDMLTKNVKWVYGGANGSKNDILYKSISELPPAEMINALTQYGFSGICLNLNGYDSTEGRNLKNELMRLSGCNDIVSSSNGTEVYINFDHVDLETEFTASEGTDYSFGNGIERRHQLDMVREVLRDKPAHEDKQI